MTRIAPFERSTCNRKKCFWIAFTSLQTARACRFSSTTSVRRCSRHAAGLWGGSGDVTTSGWKHGKKISYDRTGATVGGIFLCTYTGAGAARECEAFNLPRSMMAAAGRRRTIRLGRDPEIGRRLCLRQDCSYGPLFAINPL